MPGLSLPDFSVSRPINARSAYAGVADHGVCCARGSCWMPWRCGWNRATGECACAIWGARTKCGLASPPRAPHHPPHPPFDNITKKHSTAANYPQAMRGCPCRIGYASLTGASAHQKRPKGG